MSTAKIELKEEKLLGDATAARRFMPSWSCAAAAQARPPVGGRSLRDQPVQLDECERGRYRCGRRDPQAIADTPGLALVGSRFIKRGVGRTSARAGGGWEASSRIGNCARRLILKADNVKVTWSPSGHDPDEARIGCMHLAPAWIFMGTTLLAFESADQHSRGVVLPNVARRPPHQGRGVESEVGPRRRREANRERLGRTDRYVES